MILVTGATGNVGGAVADLLLERGVATRILTRDPARAARFAIAGAQVVAGDLMRPETLAGAFAGIDRLLLSTAPSPTLVEEQSAAIAAARATGVSAVVRVSASGAQADSPVNLLDWHGRLDEVLGESGLAWTVLQPGWFLQNYLMQAVSIARDGVVHGAMGQGRVAPVDARDVAAVAVAALTEPHHNGQVYSVTGPQSLSQPEVGSAIGRGLGIEVRYQDLPTASFSHGLRAAGLPEWLVAGLAGLHTRFAEGHGDEVTEVVRCVGQVAPTTVESFAAAHAAAFAGAAAALA